MKLTMESIAEGICTYPRWTVWSDGHAFCTTENPNDAMKLAIALAKIDLAKQMEG